MTRDAATADRSAVDARFRHSALTRRRDWSAAFKQGLAIIADSRPDGATAEIAETTGVDAHATLRGVAASPRTAVLDAAVAELAGDRLPSAMSTLLLFPLRGLGNTASSM